MRAQVLRKCLTLKHAAQSSCLAQGLHSSSHGQQQQQQQPLGDASCESPVEPDGPIVKTSIPGPRSEDMKRKLGSVQNTDSVQFFVDYERSQGNYVADVDGNKLLDLFTQISSLPIGYNHRRLFEVMRTQDTMTSFVNRAAVGSYPPLGFMEKFLGVLLSIAPEGLNGVLTTGCGTCAVENGMKAIFMGYQNRLRGGRQPTQEEMETSVMNQPPGCPKVTFLSFKDGYHGRCMGTLAMTHSKWFHKLDLPMPDWPIAPFPRLRYPLDQHIRENREEELRCLEQVESLIFDYAQAGQPVVGICVEPIQSDGGDNHATPFFFHGLQTIGKQTGCYLLLDEVQTGCGVTGRFWAHEHFKLPHPPDVVAFSKKMMVGGFYYTDELKPTRAGRIFSTWMGDTSRLLLLEAVIDEIRDMDLLDQARHVGQYLLNGLEDLQGRYPQYLSNARGLGTLCGIDLPSPETRQRVYLNLRHKGVNVGLCGEQSFRLRPSLLFEKKHADVFLGIFDSVLAEARL